MVVVLLYRGQLLQWLRTAYAADDVLGALMRKLVSLDVEGIITNTPDVLRNVIDQMNSEKLTS